MAGGVEGDLDSAQLERLAERVGLDLGVAAESVRLAVDSIRMQPLRSGLATLGVVIGIVTVVIVASVIVNVRNQVALLFRDQGFAGNRESYYDAANSYLDLVLARRTGIPITLAVVMIAIKS